MSSPTLLTRLRPLSKATPRTQTTKTLSAKRKFHSADHPPPPGPYSPTESAILTKALSHIPTHGFTLTTLSLGAKDAGYIAHDASTQLFPRGATDLVGYYLYTQRTGLPFLSTKLFSSTSFSAQTTDIRTKVKALTWSRLQSNTPIIHKWQEALSLLSTHPSLAARELHLLSDEILYLSGNADVDFSWYTQRISLSTIYASSELFMTMDKSEGFRDTKGFMERRFDDAEKVRDVSGAVGEWVGFTAGAAVNVLRSKGVRI